MMLCSGLGGLRVVLDVIIGNEKVKLLFLDLLFKDLLMYLLVWIGFSIFLVGLSFEMDFVDVIKSFSMVMI